jgi:hypothetical protein
MILGVPPFMKPLYTFSFFGGIKHHSLVREEWNKVVNAPPLNSDVHAGNRKNAESPFSLININT